MTREDTVFAIMGLDEFKDWLVSAARGDQIVYFTGELARQREEEELAAFRNRAKSRPIDALAKFVYSFSAGEALVCLVQRRVEAACFEYIAIRTDAPIQLPRLGSGKPRREAAPT